MPLHGRTLHYNLKALGASRHTSAEVVGRASGAPRVLSEEVVIAHPCRACIVVIARNRVPRVAVELPRHTRTQTSDRIAQRRIRAAAQSLHRRSRGIRDMPRGEIVGAVIPSLHGFETPRTALLGILQRAFCRIIISYEVLHKKAVAVERLQSLARLPTRGAALDNAAHRIIVLGHVPAFGAA